MESKSISKVDTSWRLLYKIGGISALVLVGITLVQLVIFMVSPPPLDGTAMDWFILFQKNSLLALLSFELLMVIYVILSVPLSLALFIALRRTNPSITAIYIVLSIIGIVSFIIARPAFEMLSLSNQYTTATTEAQKSILLASGEAIVSIFHGTAFQVSYILGSITGLLISYAMLRSNIFSKKTAYARIASSVFDFGLFIPVVGLYISLFSVFFLMAFDIIVAQRLFQLSKKMDDF
jgi:hypothetical protein